MLVDRVAFSVVWALVYVQIRNRGVRLSLFPCSVRLQWRCVTLDVSSRARRSVLVLYLAPPVSCLWHHPQTREKKNVELKVLSKPCNVLRGKQCLVASQTLVVYAPFAQRMNPERRSSLCIKMQSGWLLLMDVCRTDGLRRYVPSEVCSRRTHFTGPSLSMVCRLLTPQYRCPPSWSCRCCLALWRR